MTVRNSLTLASLIALMGCQATLVEIADTTRDFTKMSTKPLLTLAALGAAAYYVVDPLAPNWEVAQTQIDDARYRIDLRLKRFHHGGEGEAASVFQRHAEELARNWGNGEYRLVAYSEGIDSEMTGPRRWTRGVIELLPTQTSASDQ